MWYTMKQAMKYIDKRIDYWWDKVSSNDIVLDEDRHYLSLYVRLIDYKEEVKKSKRQIIQTQEMDLIISMIEAGII